ncbi:ABC transporter G family member 40, partial [Mucuna pruriens]
MSITPYGFIPPLSMPTQIWEDVSINFIIDSKVMSLRSGPPYSWKITLLLALAGKLDPKLKVAYNDHGMNEFGTPISNQNDLQIGEIREKETSIMPDPYIDAYMKGLSGAFMPGVLTALMGITSTGKTTLIDLLAARKTGDILKKISLSLVIQREELECKVMGLMGVTSSDLTYLKIMNMKGLLSGDPIMVLIDSGASIILWLLMWYLQRMEVDHTKKFAV